MPNDGERNCAAKGGCFHAYSIDILHVKEARRYYIRGAYDVSPPAIAGVTMNCE